MLILTLLLNVSIQDCFVSLNVSTNETQPVLFCKEYETSDGIFPPSETSSILSNISIVKGNKNKICVRTCEFLVNQR